MRDERRLLGLVTLIFSLTILAACAGDETPDAGATSATPTPSTTTFTEAEFRITTLAGWSREDATSSVDAKKAIRYKHASGDYFIVAIDPLGSDFSADEVWRYQVKESGFEVVEKVPCTGGPEQQCSTNDSRLDIYLLWKSGTGPEKVGGHTWYFIFGNTNTTSADRDLFEAIAESIRVTA